MISTRDRNRRAKAVRAQARRQQAADRESARQANQKRIQAIRLKGTLLDEAAKKNVAARGKTAIAEKRAHEKAQQKAAYQAALKRIDEAEKLERKTEQEAKAAAKKTAEDRKETEAEIRAGAPVTREVQKPKADGKYAGRVVGAIDVTKLEMILFLAGKLPGLVSAFDQQGNEIGPLLSDHEAADVALAAGIEDQEQREAFLIGRETTRQEVRARLDDAADLAVEGAQAAVDLPGVVQNLAKIFRARKGEEQE